MHLSIVLFVHGFVNSCPWINLKISIWFFHVPSKCNMWFNVIIRTLYTILFYFIFLSYTSFDFAGIASSRKMGNASTKSINLKWLETTKRRRYQANGDWKWFKNVPTNENIGSWINNSNDMQNIYEINNSFNKMISKHSDRQAHIYLWFYNKFWL